MTTTHKFPSLHPPVAVVEDGLDDAVPDGLGHDELGVLRAVQQQLLGNVLEPDPRVGQRNCPGNKENFTFILYEED